MIQRQPTAVLRYAGAALLACLLCLPAPGQDRDGGDGGDGGDGRDRWQLPDNATSENNRFLKQVLERYPESDTDNDGVLDKKEFQAYLPKMQQAMRNRGRLMPKHDDIPYGENQNQVIDLYLPESDTPTPLVVFFHGGQFITGDEDQPNIIDIKGFLAAGIAVASIDYRDVTVQPFPAAFEDAVTALQYLRFYAENFNLDPTRVAGFGEEAGGNLTLYLALHDDLAQKPKKLTKLQEKLANEAEEKAKAQAEQDKETEADPEPKGKGKGKAASETQVPEGERPWEDPGLKEMSTRLKGAFALHPIASFDPRAWKKHKIPMNDHERLMTKYLDVRFLEPMTDKSVIDLVEDISPLELVSADDPPLLLTSLYKDLDLTDDTTWTIMRHHPLQIQLIDKAMAAKGNKTTIRYRGMKGDSNTRSLQFLSGLLK